MLLESLWKMVKGVKWNLFIYFIKENTSVKQVYVYIYKTFQVYIKTFLSVGFKIKVGLLIAHKTEKKNKI